ncbi:MAG: hypothetical protein RLZZ01_103 [Actinomycetota bacterium]
MLVLIATDPTPSHRRRAQLAEVPAAVDGELVIPPVVDCTDVECDACASGWFGLISHGAATTATVVDRPDVTLGELRARVRDWLACIGVVDEVEPAVVDELVEAHIDDIRLICAEFRVGTALSRLGRLVSPVGGRTAA